jgi:hypothetical protein
VIRVYGVNAIFYDQWTNIALLSHSHFFSQSYVGPMSLGHLWAQHNENRMLFPNLVVLVLGSATHLNIATELFVSAAMLVVATALIVLSHRDSGRSAPWLFYCPVAVLMFSLAQIGDTLFGFQMAWYLIMLALAVTLYLLERRQLGWLLLCGAAVAAVVGSFSSFPGLIIWPAGLVVLVVRRSRGAFILAWIASAVVTTPDIHFRIRRRLSSSSSLRSVTYWATHFAPEQTGAASCIWVSSSWRSPPQSWRSTGAGAEKRGEAPPGSL